MRNKLRREETGGGIIFADSSTYLRKLISYIKKTNKLITGRKRELYLES